VISTFERAVVRPQQEAAGHRESRDWEGSSGVADDRVQPRPRVGPPRYTYRGLGDPHWQGQSCYLMSEPASRPDQRVITLACGCQASVPWWTLEPRSETA
jgi:hypothetical protein